MTRPEGSAFEALEPHQQRVAHRLHQHFNALEALPGDVKSQDEIVPGRAFGKTGIEFAASETPATNARLHTKLMGRTLLGITATDASPEIFIANASSHASDESLPPEKDSDN